MANKRIIRSLFLNFRSILLLRVAAILIMNCFGGCQALSSSLPPPPPSNGKSLEPAAPRPATHHITAATIPDPPPIPLPFEPSLVDHALLAAFRWTLQQQSGLKLSNKDEKTTTTTTLFDGMAAELLEFRRLYGLNEQERVSYQTLLALAGPVPWIYKHLFASWEASPAVLAWFAKHLLPFLVGEMTLTERGKYHYPASGSSSSSNSNSNGDSHLAGGVLVHRCRVLEETNCKGVCTKMCKLPTQRFFAEEWGVPLSMTPNFETGQCQLVFGAEPLSVAEDPTLPDGCLTRCSMSLTSPGDDRTNDAC